MINCFYSTKNVIPFFLYENALLNITNATTYNLNPIFTIGNIFPYPVLLRRRNWIFEVTT